MSGNILNVGQLIKLLEQCPSTLPVIHEGCDCFGNAWNVRICSSSDGDYILITRDTYNDDEFNTLVDDRPHMAAKIGS